MSDRPGPAGPRELLRTAGWRRIVLFAALGTVAMVLVLAAGHQLELHFGAIESRVAGLGPWRVPVYALVFVAATSLLIPDTLLCLVAGAAFGLPLGLAAVLIGSLAANSLQYALASRVMRPWFEREVAARPVLMAIRRAVRRDELRLQALLRLTPLNPALTSYLLGTAGVRFGGFLVACSGLVVNLGIAVYLGHAGRRMVRAADTGGRADRLQTMAIVLGAAACVLVMAWISTRARRAFSRAVDELDPEQRGAAGAG